MCAIVPTSLGVAAIEVVAAVPVVPVAGLLVLVVVPVLAGCGIALLLAGAGGGAIAVYSAGFVAGAVPFTHRNPSQFARCPGSTPSRRATSSSGTLSRSHEEPFATRCVPVDGPPGLLAGDAV
jgi:hypothetical protein